MVDLTGTPQVLDLTTGDCEKLVVFASKPPNHAAPFAQVRPKRQGGLPDPETPTAGLGVAVAIEGEKTLLNVWYGNPDKLPFAAETEMRLYDIGRSGRALSDLAKTSVRWWNGPIDLTSETQMARIEFDPLTVEMNGSRGLGLSNEIRPGRTYLLTLNVSHGGVRSGNVVIQQQIPILQFMAREPHTSTSVFSGITSVEHRADGAAGLVYERP